MQGDITEGALRVADPTKTNRGRNSVSENDGSDIADQIMCSVNPVQLVLYRCIELVEEKMKGC
jgi:hypothetical protein